MFFTMRVKTLLFLSSLCFLSFAGNGFTEDSYYWKEDYQKALSNAKESKKASLLVFVGSDWCPWSEKLTSDVLMNEHFLKGLKEDLQFIRLDFPEHIKQSEEHKKNLISLKEKFRVIEFPTLVLLDEEENEVIKLGYMPMQAEEFKDYIKKMLADWQSVKKEMTEENLASLSEENLESLYLKAKANGFNTFKEKILQVGLSRASGPFFMMEKYAIFIECGKKNKNAEMETLRKEIVKRDPQNKKGTQLKLAVLDFEVLAHKVDEMEDPKAAIKPLDDYVKKFGKQDKENLWRVEMMMAQYLFSKKVLRNAVKHAEASYKSAPENVKPSILETITYLKTYQ